MTNPGLFIVAGPNGAGKSLFSKKLTDSAFEVFDGDKRMVALMKKYPERVVKRFYLISTKTFLLKKNRKHSLPD